MPHKLHIITDRSGTRVGSIQAVTKASALKGFLKAIPAGSREGLRARVAQEGERA